MEERTYANIEFTCLLHDQNRIRRHTNFDSFVELRVTGAHLRHHADETAIIKTVLELEQGWKIRRSEVRRRKKLAKVRIRKKRKRYYATRVIYIRYIFTTVSRNLFVILYFTRQDSNVLWIKKEKGKTKSDVNITCELCKMSLEKDKFLIMRNREK